MKTKTYLFILCFIASLFILITGCDGCDGDKNPIQPNQAPTVSITSGPSGTITTDQATFSWSGYDTDGTISGYYYDLDDSTPDTWTTSTTKTFYSISNGSHTFYVKAKDNDGDLSTIASRSFIVNVETHETQEGMTNPNGQYSFHSDILNEDVIITTSEPGGQPAEDINVYFYSDGNDIIVTTYDSSEDYYPMAYFGSVSKLLSEKESRQPINILLNLLGLSGNLFTIIENPPTWDDNHLLNFPGIVYLGNASFQTVGSIISITGYVLACFPEATTTIIGSVASLASSAIDIAGELGLNIQQDYEWYQIIGTNFIFCLSVPQLEPGSIMGYTMDNTWVPINNVLVELYDNSNNYTGLSTYSYTEMGMGPGYFEIDNVEPGDYYLILSKSGYENKRNPSTGFFPVYEGALNNRGVILLNPLTQYFEVVATYDVMAYQIVYADGYIYTKTNIYGWPIIKREAENLEEVEQYDVGTIIFGGLSFDGTHIWATLIQDEAIRKYDTCFNTIADFSFTLPEQQYYESNPTGIDWFDNYLWITDQCSDIADGKHLHKLNSEIIIIDEYEFNIHSGASYIAWVGNTLYSTVNQYSGSHPGTIRKHSSSSPYSVEGYYELEEGYPRGLTSDGTYLWVAAKDPNIVYKLIPIN